MSKKKHPKGNPDFRSRSNAAMPSDEEIEKELVSLLHPNDFAPLRVEGKKKLRNRILTLPVMTALTVSMVWRQIASLAEALRILMKEGLLWVEAGFNVSAAALTKRFKNLPAELFAQIFQDVINRIQQDRKEKNFFAPGQEKWAKVTDFFSAVWIADGSTLEELKKKLKTMKDEKAPILAGKMMMMVEAFTHIPTAAFYTSDPNSNDKTFVEQLINKLPEKGLLIFDLGFFSFPFFDSFYPNKFFITLQREKTAYEVIQTLSKGARYKDEIIEMGQYRSNPCKHQVRMISILWDTKWYRYLTNVMDPEILSARQVCELYFTRWRIEEAFNMTKRRLGLSYLWVSNNNGVQIQIYATWIFYAVLCNICVQVAKVLNLPLHRISQEMVFRNFYYYARARQKGESLDLVSFLVSLGPLFGIVKKIRKTQKQKVDKLQEIWGSIA